MKTKFKNISKTTFSLLLTLMMLFSCVTSSGALTAEPKSTHVAVNETIAQTDENTIFLDNQPKDVTTNVYTEERENNTFSGLMRNVPNFSGDSSTTVYFINDLGWQYVYLNVWGGINGAPSYPGIPMTCIDSDLRLYAVDLASNSTGTNFSLSTNAQVVHGTSANATSSTGYTNTGRLIINNLTCGVVYHRTKNASTECTIDGTASGRFLYSDYSSTKTIYYKSSSSVTEYAHFWNNSKSTWWYGIKMTEVDSVNHIYSITIPSSATNVIFTNDGGNQTSDLTIPSDGKNEYDATTNNWTTYSVATQHTVSINPPSYGTLVVTSGVNDNKSLAGSTVKFTATPTNTTNYYTSSVTVAKTGDASTTVTAEPTSNPNEYSFIMPDYDVTISATFAEKETYTITASVAEASAGRGIVSPTSTTALTGDSVMITATPSSEDYLFDSWTITGSYTFATGSTASTAAVTIYPTSNVTLVANFREKSVVRIYFHDKAEMGLPQVYFWNNSNDSNNNGWPGYSCIMTPVDGYINMYYVDIDTSAITYDIDRLIINNMYRNNEASNNQGQNMGAQTKNYELAAGKKIEDYNNKVFVVDASYDNNDAEKKYGCTVPLLGNTTYDFDTYTNETNRSTNGVKLEGDNGYQRIYFYDKNKKFNTGYAYVQYGTGNNDLAHLDYKNVRSTSKSTTDPGSGYMDWYFPGKRMVPITDNPNYNSGNLYYADVPLFTTSGTRRLSFSDGYQWRGQNHITKSVTFPNVGNIVQLNGNNDGDGQGYFVGYKLLTELDSGLVYITITQEHSVVDDGTINVWAKRGTTRDGEQPRNDGTYSNYICNTNTTIAYKNTSDGTLSPDGSVFNGHVNKYNVKKGKTITITTTINATNKNKYYVKAFCINGYSYGIISEPAMTDSKVTTGVYTYDFKIPEDMTETDLEITPIFYYLEKSSANVGNDFITFCVEDFMAEASVAWGKTLSCYAWYDEGSKGYDKVDGKRPALGGYPGQPMVYQDGVHYMQVPRYVYYADSEGGSATAHEIQGITLSNYYWDDVHFFKGYLGEKANNCQTYDYDDFVALLKYPNLKSIIFSFKYRTNKESSGGNNPEIQNRNTSYLYSSHTIANRWEPLVDYYNVSVDLFGFKTKKNANECYSESDIKTQIIENRTAFNSGTTNGDELPHKFLYVVSNGYEEQEADYIGYYATKWYIYNQNGEYLGALPPSAFEWDPSTYVNNNTDAPDTAPDGFLNSSSKAQNFTNRGDLWNTYKTIFNAKTTVSSGTSANGLQTSGDTTTYTYRNLPVIISYETSYGSHGSQGNYGIRGDGRWYYSLTGAQVHASTMIQIVNANGSITDDPFNENGKGTTTNANAYFTNAEFYHQNESGLVFQSDENYFTFEADGVVLGSDNKKYAFVGWYLNRGADTYTPVNAETDLYKTSGSKAMNSNAVFVARYVEVTPDNNELTIAHMPYSQAARTYPGSPTLGNGTGKTSVQVRILDESGNELNVIDKTSSTAKVALSKLNQTGAKYLEVTLYNEDNDPISAVYRDTGSAYQPIFNPDNNSVTDSNSVTEGSPITDLSTDTSLKYVYDISSFLLEEGALKSDKKEIYYYSNYDKNRQLTITHELLKSVVEDREYGLTVQNALDSIVGKDSNTITPHEDMFVGTSGSTEVRTATKVTVDYSLTTSPDNYTNLKEITEGGVTIKKSDIPENCKNLKITLTTTTGNGNTPDANNFYFLNSSDSKYYTNTEANTTEGTYMYNGTENTTTANISTCTFIIPVSNIYDSSTSKFKTDVLSFFSDPQKTITVNLKYYDRKVVDNEAADINEQATTNTFTYSVGEITSTGVKDKFNDFQTMYLTKFNVDNILDQYTFMGFTQDQAIGNISNKKYYSKALDKTVEETQKTCGYTYNDYYTKKGDAFKASFSGDEPDTDTDILKYHTNAHGQPHTAEKTGDSTADEKWVTYTDGNDSVDPATSWSTVKTATFWLYNEPKAYTFKAYYTAEQEAKDAEGSAPATPAVTSVDLTDGTNVIVAQVTYADNNDTNEGSNTSGTQTVYINKTTTANVDLKGFYNQRIGLSNDEAGYAYNDVPNYLSDYGINKAFFGTNSDTTGIEVVAVKDATYKKTGESDKNLVFDGWYIYDSTGFHKVSTDRNYMNRIVCDLTLYAGYVEENASQDKIGLAVTLNGVDRYVNNKAEDMVRINTELCVYGTEIDNTKYDEQITEVASIYFTVPNTGTYNSRPQIIDWTNNDNKKALQNYFKDTDDTKNLKRLREQIIYHLQCLEGYYNGVNIPYSVYTTSRFTINVVIGDVELDSNGTVNCFSYTVTGSVDRVPDKTTQHYTLTNKNRIQFVMDMSASDYDNYPFMAFVAMRCRDKKDDGSYDTTHTWYLSDNFVTNFELECTDDPTVTSYPPVTDPTDPVDPTDPANPTDPEDPEDQDDATEDELTNIEEGTTTTNSQTVDSSLVPEEPEVVIINDELLAYEF